MALNRLNVLFLCAKNRWRSPTGEALYREDTRLCVRSAGVKRGANRYVTETDIQWAHVIFVMEREHKRIISERFAGLVFPQIVVLDIPDDYEYMHPDLQALIRTAVDPIIQLIIGENGSEQKMEPM